VNRIEIGSGGVHGGTAADFALQNRFLAKFCCA